MMLKDRVGRTDNHRGLATSRPRLNIQGFMGELAQQSTTIDSVELS